LSIATRVIRTVKVVQGAAVLSASCSVSIATQGAGRHHAEVARVSIRVVIVVDRDAITYQARGNTPTVRPSK
jgi:hypothetical protein